MIVAITSGENKKYFVTEYQLLYVRKTMDLIFKLLVSEYNIICLPNETPIVHVLKCTALRVKKGKSHNKGESREREFTETGNLKAKDFGALL